MRLEALAGSVNSAQLRGCLCRCFPFPKTERAAAGAVFSESLAGVEAIEATMTSVDRLGFTLRLKTSDGVKGTRINFPREVTTAEDTRAVLVEMVKQAR